MRHGRYATIQRERIRDLIAQHEADPDPLNVLPELAALRALFQDFIERYDLFVDALLAWHDSYRAAARPIAADRIASLGTLCDEVEAWIGPAEEDPEDDDYRAARAALKESRALLETLSAPVDDAKPRQILDIADARMILAEIGKLTERVQKARSANFISRPNLNRIMQQLWASVDVRVTDEDVKERIREDWLSVVTTA